MASITKGVVVASCKKFGNTVSEENQQYCSSCKEQATEIFQQKEMKDDNTAHWVGIIVGGILAGISAKILSSNGIHLGFIPAVVIWFVAYCVVKTVAKRIM